MSKVVYTNLARELRTFEIYHEELLEGPYQEDYRKYCEKYNLIHFFDEAKNAKNFVKDGDFLTKEGFEKWANNSDMKKALLDPETNELKRFGHVFDVHIAINNRLYKLMKNEPRMPNMDIFYGNSIDENFCVYKRLVELYELYYEYKLLNLQEAFLQSVRFGGRPFYADRYKVLN